MDISRFPTPLKSLSRTTAHQDWREQKEGGMKGVKRDGWIMSDHKRVGLHWAFPPSSLSAAPGSNIHLAWCIPGFETLMWFVGESRWQVHGSTLLTDSADASGRVHNNAECFSPPSFPLLSDHTPYPKPPAAHTHTHARARFLSFHCVGTGRLQRESFGMLTLSTALSVLRSIVFHFLFPSMFLVLLLPCLALSTSYSVSVHISSVLLHYTHSYSRHTHAHAPWLVPHHPLAPIHSINHSPHSCFFTSPALLYVLPPSTYSRIGHFICLVLPLQCRNDVMP